MRIFIAVMAAALLMVGTITQGMAKGKRQQQDATKTEDQAKKKAADEAFQKAGKTIPNRPKSPTLGKACASKAARRFEWRWERFKSSGSSFRDGA